MRSLLAFICAPFVALVLLAGPAGAQDDCYPSCSTTTVQPTTTTTSPSGTLSDSADDASGDASDESAAPAQSGGTLPITGGDVGSIIVIGVVAMAAGAALLLSSRPSQA